MEAQTKKEENQVVGGKNGGKILHSLTDYKNKNTVKKKAFNFYELI